MIIQYGYNVGDTVEVKPLSIFTNPEPIEWNDHANGYGHEYKEYSQFTFQKSLDLFAQYEPIFITYHLTSMNEDGNISNDIISYYSRVGSNITVTDFPWISSGFKCWIDEDGNPIEVRQHLHLTSTVDLYMSSDFTYALQFNANGGSGQMASLSATKHVYVDRDTENPVVENATIELPECAFTNQDMIFIAWNIDGNYLQPRQTYILQKDAIAIAEWKKPIKYILNVDSFLYNQNFIFRYFMLKINHPIDNGAQIRFSKICFVDPTTHTELFFPSNTQITSKNIYHFAYGQNAQNCIDGKTDTTTAIYRSEQSANLNRPCGLIFDLNKPLLDLHQYRHMQIWTAKDSSSNSSANMNSFELYVSNNGKNWFLAYSYSGSVNTGNAQISHESDDLHVASQETKIAWD